MSRPRSADGRFQKFLASFRGEPPFLPLVHTTTAYKFADIYPSDELRPTSCPVFNEPLLYFFYGRPAYRARDTANSDIEFNWPIIFVISHEALPSIKRVFPFDTGAFDIGIYKEFFHKDSLIQDFQLPGRIESACAVVRAFYGNNREYFRGQSTKNVEIPLMEFEASGIQQLSRLAGVQIDPSTKRRDERSSAIELQTSDPISLLNNISAIILPQQYFQKQEIRDALARWQPKLLEHYDTLHNQSGDAWVGQIYAIVRGVYEKLGYLEKTL